jgi:hypothetical protein
MIRRKLFFRYTSVHIQLHMRTCSAHVTSVAKDKHIVYVINKKRSIMSYDQHTNDYQDDDESFQLEWF